MFSVVYVSSPREGDTPYVTTTHDASTPRPNPHRPVGRPGGQDWRPVQACSREAPCWYWHLVVATETGTVGKQAVSILLESSILVHRSVPFQAHFEFLYSRVYHKLTNTRTSVQVLFGSECVGIDLGSCTWGMWFAWILVSVWKCSRTANLLGSVVIFVECSWK